VSSNDYDLGPDQPTPTDANILWGATIDGVSNKLPTRAAAGIQLDVGRAVDNLETISGLVVARVGAPDAIPPVLTTLAARVVEYGAAALFEQQDFPEASTSDTSNAAVLWKQYEDLLQQLEDGVEAVGGEPNVQLRPIFTFDPPYMVRYREF